MTKAELNAHWALPNETLGDSYTITHKREREAFVKGWHKAVELCCEWLENHNDYQRALDNGRGIRFDIMQCIIDLRKAMKE